MLKDANDFCMDYIDLQSAPRSRIFWGTSQADSVSSECTECHGDKVILKQRKQRSLHLPPRRAVAGLTLRHCCRDNCTKQECPGQEGMALVCNLHSGQRWRPGPGEKPVLSAWATHSHSFPGENQEVHAPFTLQSSQVDCVPPVREKGSF